MTEDGRIICIKDGIVANSIKQLKLLDNLINDKVVDRTERTERQSSNVNLFKFRTNAQFIQINHYHIILKKPKK